MTHYWTDAHPDHVAACQLVEAARFWAKLTKSDIPGEPHHPEKIFHYFSVHLKMLPQPDFVHDISEFWQQKLAAIRCFESQFITGRPTEPPTFLDQLQNAAATMGASIGTAYGEPYASREPVGLTSLRDLVEQKLESIARHKVGNRPNRVEPRAVKRRPKKQTFLMKPRDEARKELLGSATTAA